MYKGTTGLASGWGTTKAYKHNKEPPRTRRQCRLKENYIFLSRFYLKESHKC